MFTQQVNGLRQPGDIKADDGVRYGQRTGSGRITSSRLGQSAGKVKDSSKRPSRVSGTKRGEVAVGVCIKNSRLKQAGASPAGMFPHRVDEKEDGSSQGGCTISVG